MSTNNQNIAQQQLLPSIRDSLTTPQTLGYVSHYIACIYCTFLNIYIHTNNTKIL